MLRTPLEASVTALNLRLMTELILPPVKTANKQIHKASRDLLLKFERFYKSLIAAKYAGSC
jgi:hypothetical protein